MSVFTVYNCGTGANRNSDGEVIAFLARATTGPEAGGPALNPNGVWMITDGVGKARNKDLGSAYTPGVHNPVTGKANAPKGLRHLAKAVGLVRGNVGGFGWEQNVEYAVQTIAGLRELPTKINMAGWSRGAITCHKLAHKVYEIWPEIPVNIFAFDPVPGPGNFQEANITLPPNVKFYSVMQMEDEARWIMRPMTISDQPLTSNDLTEKSFHYYGMPGQHDTGVMFMNSEVGQIGASLACKFLKRHGTAVDGLALDRNAYLENYAKVRMKMASFRMKKGGGLRVIGNPSTGFNFRRGLNPGFASSKFFVNEHHRSAFAKFYPQLVSYLDNGVSRPGQDPRVQLRALSVMLPQTYLALDGLGWMPQ